MKRFALLIAVLTGLLASGCGGSATRSAADFTVEIYTPEYASGFDIRGRDKDAATLVTVRNPWQGAGNVEQHLLILREGAKAPAGLDAQVVKAPVRHVVCMSSSHVAMFDALGEVRRISGVSGIDYISNTYVNEHRYCGEVRDVGYDTNLNFELLASMRPDLVLLYGVTGENTVVTGKLRELGIPYIYVGDYMEESPLGKAEWLMVAAELCNVRDKGAETFRGIAARYNALKTRIAGAARSPRPKVMLNTPYRDTWFMPSSRSFMVRLIEDAGGEYVYTKNDSDTSVAVDPRGGLPAGFGRRHVDQRRPVQYPGRTHGPEPQVRGRPRRSQPAGLQQQPPPDPCRRLRFLGVGRHTPRPGAARPVRRIQSPSRRHRGTLLL